MSQRFYFAKAELLNVRFWPISLYDSKLTDDRAPAEEGKDPFGAGARNHRNLEEPVLDAIAAVVGRARSK